MLSREWLQAFVPVGVAAGPGQWVATGAGVLFLEHGLLWLVTARHVVLEAGKDHVSPLLTTTDGGVVVVQIGKVQHSAGFAWVEDERADLAATPLPTTSGLAVKAVTRRECIPIGDVIPSMPSFTVGCPYGLAGLEPGRPTPLVMDGVVSAVRPSEDLIFTSAPTFPGNSGGPLMVYRNPFAPSGALVVGEPVVYLAGIILQTQLVADHRHPGIPPLHLGMARSSDAILRLLDSEAARATAARLLAQPPPSASG